MRIKYLLYFFLFFLFGVTANAQPCGAYFVNSNNGLTVSFIDSSFANIGNISSYSWTLGDSTTSSQPNPVHTYAQAGTYAVCLDIVTSVGCRDTYCDSIVVTPFPCIADFSYQSDTTNTVTFFNSSTPSGNVTYLWDFGDNSTDTTANPVHTYANAGIYSVSLTINGSVGTGVSCTIIDTIYANYCDAFFTYQIGSNGNVSFIGIPSSSDASSYTWDFGDGSSNIFQKNTTHTYGAPGLYNATFSLFDSLTSLGCNYTDSIRIQTNLPCAAGFNTTVSQNVVFIQNMATNSTQYFYDFGDGYSTTQSNPTHSYIRSGTYTILQVVRDTATQCVDSATKQVTAIVPSPCQANFSYTVFQRTLSIQNLANNFTNLLYNFGDGTTSSQISPTHTYLQDGTYLVCQTVNDTNGCADIFCDTVNIITTQCKAGFSYNVTLDTVRFNSKASFFTGVHYDFGDNTFSTKENPTHVYTQSGTYLVCQTVIDSTNNCLDVFCDTLTVNVPQLCVAGYNYSVNNKTLSIVNTATNYTSLMYDFGDGITSNQANTTHTYMNSGTYQVCQTVYDGNRCMDMYCDSITISPSVQCQAGFNYSVIGDSILFENTATNFNRLVYYFGDGDSSTALNPYHSYQRSDSYVVRQVIYNDINSCSDMFIDTIPVTVSRSCVAQFVAALDTNQSGTLFLINISTDDETHSYHWDFGDGASGSGRTPTHRYTANQRHNICLTVNDDIQNCSSTYCELMGLDSLGGLLKNGGYLLKVIDGQFIGIEEASLLETMKLYPNPTNDRIHLELDDDIINLNYALYSVKGQLLVEGEFNKQSNQIEMKDYPNGVYLLRLMNGKESVVKRIMKQ